MTALQFVYIAVILNWIGLIGLAVTVVRLQERFSKSNLGHSVDDDGPAVGSQAPVLVGHASPRLADDAEAVLPQLIWFMRSNCTPCRESRSIVGRIANAYEGKLDCLVSYAGTSEEASEFGQLWDAHIDPIPDPERANAKGWLVRRVPFVFLVGKDGVIQWKGKGFSKDLESALEAHLARHEKR
jgi:hypothetical protein